MAEWWMSGGFGMFLVLATGIAGLGVGATTVRDPRPGRLAALRAFPALVATVAVFAFGVNMWAVNRALESTTLAKSHGLTPADMPLVGLVGICESAQVFTLGGLLAALIVGVSLVASMKHAGQAGSEAAA